MFWWQGDSCMDSSAQGWLAGEQGRGWFARRWLLGCPPLVEGEPWGNFEDSGPRQCGLQKKGQLKITIVKNLHLHSIF